MPFGKEPDLKKGTVIDFDQLYREAIKCLLVSGNTKQRSEPCLGSLKPFSLL
jgi:hypothetical protein